MARTSSPVTWAGAGARGRRGAVATGAVETMTVALDKVRALGRCSGRRWGGSTTRGLFCSQRTWASPRTTPEESGESAADAEPTAEGEAASIHAAHSDHAAMPANHPGVSRDGYVSIGRADADLPRTPHTDLFVRLN